MVVPNIVLEPTEAYFVRSLSCLISSTLWQHVSIGGNHVVAGIWAIL